MILGGNRTDQNLTELRMDTPPKNRPEPTVPSPKRKPRYALFIATACALGYIPIAPGTFGSLAGLALALSVYQILAALSLNDFQIIFIRGTQLDPLVIFHSLIAFAVAV